MEATDYSEATRNLEEQTMAALRAAGLADLVRLWEAGVLTPTSWAMHACSLTGWDHALLLGSQPEAGAAQIFRRMLKLLHGDAVKSDPDLGRLLEAELSAACAPQPPDATALTSTSSWQRRQLSGELLARLTSLQHGMEHLVSEARSTAEHCALATVTLFQEEGASTLPEDPPRMSPSRKPVNTPLIGARTRREQAGADPWEENRRRLREFYQRVASNPLKGETP
jgi:hypothetical protein